MNKQKAMMILYKSTWIVLVAAAYILQEKIDLRTIFFAVIVCMIIATFTAMYLASKESLGASYAKRNLGLAVTLTLVGGIGFVIWPILVNTEIKKFRDASNQSTTTLPHEA